MGRLGTMELVLIFTIALVVFGPSRLPELGKMAGRSIGSFKRYINSYEAEWVEEENVKQEVKLEEQRKEELVVDARTVAKESE